MPEATRRLSVVTKEDPQSLLSQAARLRISDAYARQLVIRHKALASVYARCNSVAWDELDGEAREKLSAGKREAAFTVLSVVCREFMAIGKIGESLVAVMRDELDAAANSLELSGFDKQAIWSELSIIGPEHSKAGPVLSTANGYASRNIIDEGHGLHVQLYDRIINKISLEQFLHDHPRVSRTSLTDYVAGRIPGRVSVIKRSAIESAIKQTAASLGL